MFMLVTLGMVKTSNVERRLSELEVERQRSCNVSVSVMCVPTLPLKENKINLTISDIGQDHLEGNDQLGLSSDSENIAIPEVCASQWLQDVITVEEILNCIEDYTKNEQLRMQSPLCQNT
jgi:hypothetical protein